MTVLTASCCVSSNGSFWECLPSVPVFQMLLLLFLFGKCLLYTCRLKEYSQPKSWELYFIQREFWGLQAQEATSQVKEYSAFLCMGRCKSLGSLNHSFDMHLSYLGAVSCIFISWVSWGLTIGSGCSLMADMAGNIPFLRSSPLGQEFDRYLGDTSWSNFVPQHWEAHPRSGKNS